ncbi:hypothetical protein K0M31_003099 [Melipona bicolor]|uniref:Uncharacterized protein n=1 Tax=Melipona bicolor TaxID=60889 RepID=A0AA40G0D5_9HYME|nr:hypothetical protein K0M31_003099 [Melipona bicolor]
MSPDPTQEPVEESLNVPNLPLDRGINASDSEDDEIGMAGYVPLSQIPADSDPMLYEDEDDEWISNAGESNQTLRSPILESQNYFIFSIGFHVGNNRSLVISSQSVEYRYGCR